MRSDWDDRDKKTGLQKRYPEKRYPNITREEWQMLLRWARSHLNGLVEHLPPPHQSEVDHAAALVRKIEARLGD